MQPFSITPIYDILLRGNERTPVGLYHLQLASAEQLTRLHYSRGSFKTIRARLKTLVDQGYVQADAKPTKLFKSPYYYMLGEKGMKYLKALGYDTHEAWRADKELDRNYLFLEHTLELNDVLISAALLKRMNSRFYLDDFTHERVLKRQPYKASWQDEHGTHNSTVIPDARLDFRDGQRRMPVLLEHDRGTEEQYYFRRRIHAYIMLIKTESYKELFGTNALTVAFTTFVGDTRLQQMRRWARAELVAERRDIGLYFWFASLTPPLSPQLWLEPVWQSPYDDDQAQALIAA